jgi:hypothetical protein
VASGISEQQEENSMIFPRLPLLLMEFEGIWEHYLTIGSEYGLEGYFKFF